jgi:1,4-dihydroxy-2-naphthoyl-CoA hydrolase
MSIWHGSPALQDLIRFCENTMVTHLGIELLELGDDFITAKMPVDARTVQPARMLHGGASVTLAESLGSIAGSLCVDLTKQQCVGLEINANHVRAVKSGWVYGTARPLHRGRRTQIWEIRIEDDQQRLVCISRLTLAVLDLPGENA